MYKSVITYLCILTKIKNLSKKYCITAAIPAHNRRAVMPQKSKDGI